MAHISPRFRVVSSRQSAPCTRTLIPHNVHYDRADGSLVVCSESSAVADGAQSCLPTPDRRWVDQWNGGVGYMFPINSQSDKVSVSTFLRVFSETHIDATVRFEDYIFIRSV